MSEIYIDGNSHFGVHSNTNYSRLNEIEESNRIMLEWIIGIFGARLRSKAMIGASTFS